MSVPLEVAGAVLAAIAATSGVGKHFSDEERKARVQAWSASLKQMTMEEGVQAVYAWYAKHDTPPLPANINEYVSMVRAKPRPRLEKPVRRGITRKEFLERHPEYKDTLKHIRLKGE